LGRATPGPNGRGVRPTYQIEVGGPTNRFANEDPARPELIQPQSAVHSPGNGNESEKGFSAMQERVKVFTYISGTGSTVIGSALEDQLNRWMETTEGEIVTIVQSESERHNVGQHVTVCVWYIPYPKTSDV